MLNSDQARDDTDAKSSRSPSAEVAEQLIECEVSAHCQADGAARWMRSKIHCLKIYLLLNEVLIIYIMNGGNTW